MYYVAIPCTVIVEVEVSERVFPGGRGTMQRNMTVEEARDSVPVSWLRYPAPGEPVRGV